jgi:ADP-dependent NAD(P)H-hydrate dehydratase / NAD(P)H-hydrate epimerase
MHPSVDPDFASQLLMPAVAADNKYTRGTVGFVTGSQKYPGAALLGIEAAFEFGIGMVRYLGPKLVTDLVLSNRPEVVPGLDRASVVVVGSGIAESDASEQLANIAAAISLAVPLVVDAGALALIDYKSLTAPAVLTPHAVEAAKLYSRLVEPIDAAELEKNPEAIAIKLAEVTGAIVVLKNNTTLVAMPGFEPVESGPGSTHLATAGTGDVLAGMIGALTAKATALGMEITLGRLAEIAIIANQLHSEAAEIAASRGEFGATNICRAISDAVNA